jgi:hypothetical protein
MKPARRRPGGPSEMTQRSNSPSQETDSEPSGLDVLSPGPNGSACNKALRLQRLHDESRMSGRDTDTLAGRERPRAPGRAAGPGGPGDGRCQVTEFIISKLDSLLSFSPNLELYQLSGFDCERCNSRCQPEFKRRLVTRVAGPGPLWYHRSRRRVQRRRLVTVRLSRSAGRPRTVVPLKGSQTREPERRGAAAPRPRTVTRTLGSADGKLEHPDSDHVTVLCLSILVSITCIR